LSAAAGAVRPFVGPGRVLAGAGAVAGVGSELHAGGADPKQGAVAVVADRAVLELRLVDPVRASIEAAGFDVELSAPVDGEPTADSVSALLASISGGPFAAVVAVGGGSALDVGKLLSLSLENDLDLSAGLAVAAEVVPGPPVLAIPTTAGTGAEATAVAMLWHAGLKRMFVHAQLVPRMAVLDAELVSGLPPAITAASGMDAISHAVESLLSTFRTPLTEAAAGHALAALARSLPSAYREAGADERFDTLVGAYQAGLALNAQVVLGHSIAYAIGARTGLPHGLTCAMALPYCLAHSRPAAEPQIAKMAELVCGTSDPRDFLRWVVGMNETMSIPASLAEVGIEADALPAMAQEVLERYPRPNHPVEIELQALEQLLARFLRGELDDAWAEAGIGAPVGSTGRGIGR
jgi:alcohol dehydrogenase class IV